MGNLLRFLRRVGLGMFEELEELPGVVFAVELDLLSMIIPRDL
jgi:hypothetical protein